MDQMTGMILNTKVDKKMTSDSQMELLIILKETAKMTMKIRLRRKDAVECIAIEIIFLNFDNAICIRCRLFV